MPAKLNNRHTDGKRHDCDIVNVLLCRETISNCSDVKMHGFGRSQYHMIVGNFGNFKLPLYCLRDIAICKIATICLVIRCID